MFLLTSSFIAYGHNAIFFLFLPIVYEIPTRCPPIIRQPSRNNFTYFFRYGRSPMALEKNDLLGKLRLWVGNKL